MNLCRRSDLYSLGTDAAAALRDRIQTKRERGIDEYVAMSLLPNIVVPRIAAKKSPLPRVRKRHPLLPQLSALQ